MEEDGADVAVGEAVAAEEAAAGVAVALVAAVGVSDERLRAALILTFTVDGIIIIG